MYTDVHFSTDLRLICARALYLYHLFAKALEAAHLRFKRLMERVLIIHQLPVLKTANRYYKENQFDGIALPEKVRVPVKEAAPLICTDSV